MKVGQTWFVRCRYGAILLVEISLLTQKSVNLTLKGGNGRVHSPIMYMLSDIEFMQEFSEEGSVDTLEVGQTWLVQLPGGYFIIPTTIVALAEDTVTFRYVAEKTYKREDIVFMKQTD